MNETGTMDDFGNDYKTEEWFLWNEGYSYSTCAYGGEGVEGFWESECQYWAIDV